jgi:hypothetical protein
VIFVEPRDPRLVTLRRGGLLTDEDHRRLAWWAGTCAEHVLPIFEAARPEDARPRQAIEVNRAWTRGELNMRQALGASDARGAARGVAGAAKFAALAASQAVAVAHVAAHQLGAAAYAIRAVQAAEGEAAGRRERQWQRDPLPPEIRDLALDDQRLRNHACWFVFGDERSWVTRSSGIRSPIIR